MKIGIIGAGSIGLLTGAYLGENHEIHMFVRNERQKQILKTEGIVCDGLPSPTSVHAHMHTTVHEGFDLWIVTVKQHSLPALLAEQLPKDAPYLFLQNGMGHLAKIQETNLSSYVGVVEHGALATADNKVSHTGKGNIQLAAFTHVEEHGVQPLAETLHRRDFPFIPQEDYERMLKNKIVINTVINSLTALFFQPNHSILTNPSMRELAYSLCEEACTVLGMSIEKEWERVKQIAEITGENQSSMLKDLLENRLTEIDSISGYVLRKSKGPLPYHQFVVRAIHALEYERGLRRYG
ncbi:2-dehydropantoate 2-reductase [Halobacillus karajensis]|uniref:2-dehydropantoate 2-reductase n=1 Tax=Halobacillus karajensis TaxID=195088 RepID=A0A024P3W3_9BACI|nr:2-dehydropantoate 2-reductase [Halobacillus karajensis]CDQ19852.1 putative 2-dehydropantoate 2-reductase [Halobacillus karajensis]CDQ22312.1 putative 2-dehydropantoate 2-reductase [Halobacillus karajensis]CDQ28153.1 putative 2-dehydropantoate 2-reductase [Halobacillus karajensis]